MTKYSLSNLNRVMTSLILMSFTLTPSLSYADGLASDYDAIPPVISMAGSSDKPNIMLILDNSNSMDEATDGHAVGSDSAESKSEIARTAIKSIINTYGDSMRMGLMAYDQDTIRLRQLHDSQYDASFNPDNYDATYTGNRDSLTKAKRVVNPTDTSNFIYYNIALPFYSSSDQGNAFCYSSTADFDNGSETFADGPWDSYSCYTTKTGTSDSGVDGMGGDTSSGAFSPTDSDIAQNILDFGTYLTWQHVGDTWFANSSPGGGQVYVDLDDVTTTQKTALFNKLATSQFSVDSDAADKPLRNAGLTPIQGTLNDATSYISSHTTSTTNQCTTEDKYLILVTDGLPSVDSSGNAITDTTQAITDAAAEAASAFALGIKTYVIGFALPAGVDSDLLDTIAIAGGTEKAYPADDSDKLNAALNTIFLNIVNRSSSGTGAAVLANNSRGDGAFYQALYVPTKKDSLGNEITWIGVLNGLFIDQYGYLREDSNGNDAIDDYATDKIVEYFYDETQNQTRVYLKTSSDASDPEATSTTETVEIDDLKYVWSARDQLAAITNPVSQRSYTTSAGTGRAIYTTSNGTALTDFVVPSAAEQQAIKDAADTAKTALEAAELVEQTSEAAKTEAYQKWTDTGSGIGNALELAYQSALTQWEEDKAALELAQTAYDEAVSAVLNAEFYGYMAVPGTDITNVVSWIRGEEISGYRSRSLDWNDSGATQVWRLGDIIHSTPVVVASPKDRYDLSKSDSTYAAFVDKYYNRRHVIYVGANDGMLHAFNAGFWDDSSKSFKTDNSFSTSDGTSTVTAHPLGSELWAYVPKASLPHLQWLTSTNYSHTYYVDGEPLTFDANIFANDTDHPNGWGTVLVVPMRLGGGAFSVDTDGDGTDDEVLRSSIAIFDITNPEAKPILLAEITHEDLGFTTSKPAVIKARIEGSTGGFASASANRWVLAFGSGPNLLDTATSDQTAKLFLYDLESLSFVTNYDPFDLSDINSFVGDIGVADWDSDYVDDTLYFGVNSGIGASETGRIARVRLGSSDTTNFDEDTWVSYGLSHSGTLLNTQRTMLGAPLAVRDDNGKQWVYGGTGRLLVADDNDSSLQQYYAGIIEPVDADGIETLATVATSTLENTTDIRVFTNAEVDRNGSVFEIPSGTDIENFSQLEYAISKHKQGWYHELDYTNATSASGRNINGAARFRSLIFYTEYTPSNAADKQCSPEGSSTLHAIHYKTGTATPYDVIGIDANITKNDGELVLSGLDLGKGLASAPTIITNNAGSKDNSAGTLAIQLGTGELKLINFGEGGTRGGRESWQEIEMDGLDL